MLALGGFFQGKWALGEIDGSLPLFLARRPH